MLPIIAALMGIGVGTGAIMASKSKINSEDDITPSLKIPMVAALLGVSVHTVRNLVRDKKINATLSSRKEGLNFSKDEVINYAKKNNIKLNLDEYAEILMGKELGKDNIPSADLIKLQKIIDKELKVFSNLLHSEIEKHENHEQVDGERLKIIYRGLKAELEKLNDLVLNNEDADQFIKQLQKDRKHDIIICELLMYDLGLKIDGE